MHIVGIDFKTWCYNHEDSHKAKWCREVYPWPVFANADYGDDKVGSEQNINFDSINYRLLVKNKRRQDNGRYRFDIDLNTEADSRTKAWKVRSWNDTFTLISSFDGHFITLFTQNPDPSIQIVSDFMSGEFQRVTETRSRPIAALLAKTLLSYAVTEVLGEMEHYTIFPVLQGGHRVLTERPEFRKNRSSIRPLFSRGRKIWVSYCFYEDKAHRWAILNANQCETLIQLFCNPIVTPHHRCDYPDVGVLSLYQFVAEAPQSIRAKFEPHIRLLQNHLNESTFTESLASPEEYRTLIFKGGGDRNGPVKLSEAREALAQLATPVIDIFDFVYLVAAANALNAWINTSRKSGVKTVPKEAYTFKSVTAKTIEVALQRRFREVEIYVAKDDVTYVRVFGVQFSFHNLPRTPAILNHMNSAQNRVQEWSGIRLQPIAGLVLEWARALRAAERRKQPAGQ